MKNDRWKQYYDLTKNKPPSKLLVKALPYIEKKGKALDLGAGAFVDSKFLLAQGFNVTAVDSSPTSLELSEEIRDPNFSFIPSAYDTFDFELKEYDLITAQWALPFNTQKTFRTMFESLKSSLKPGGIFAGQFFGWNDQWNTGERDMTFHSKEEALHLLSEMKIISFDEEEGNRKTANGEMKHWHVFHIIAQRPLKKRF
jgi:tellurite methyltransferase